MLLRERPLTRLPSKFCLAAAHEFVPIAIKTMGPVNASGVALLNSIGRRLSQVTDDPRETAFLLQRI